MKATSLELSELKQRIASAAAASQLNLREIGETSDVHPSQVSRICRGDFKTISHNVVQVCRTLGLAVDGISTAAGVEDASWSRIEASARSVWDRSPEGAERIARILTTIGELRAR